MDLTGDEEQIRRTMIKTPWGGNPVATTSDACVADCLVFGEKTSPYLVSNLGRRVEYGAISCV